MPTNPLLCTYVLTGGEKRDASASWPSSFEACSVRLPKTIDVDTRRGATGMHRLTGPGQWHTAYLASAHPVYKKSVSPRGMFGIRVHVELNMHTYMLSTESC